MAIDFTIPEEAKEVRERVRKWVQEECIPAEKAMAAGKPYKEVLAELRAKARAKGLWLPFFPVEHGGMGLTFVGWRLRLWSVRLTVTH